MNDSNENVLITAYNLFCTILIPAVIILTGIWSLEAESDFTHGRTGGLPIGALIVFVPEVIFGLKWKMKKVFTIPCSNNPKYNSLFRFIWLVTVVLGTIFLLTIKWG